MDFEQNDDFSKASTNNAFIWKGIQVTSVILISFPTIYAMFWTIVSDTSLHIKICAIAVF